MAHFFKKKPMRCHQGGGGQVIMMLAFYSHDLSLNPTKVSIILLKKEIISLGSIETGRSIMSSQINAMSSCRP